MQDSDGRPTRRRHESMSWKPQAPNRTERLEHRSWPRSGRRALHAIAAPAALAYAAPAVRSHGQRGVRERPLEPLDVDVVDPPTIRIFDTDAHRLRRPANADVPDDRPFRSRGSGGRPPGMRRGARTSERRLSASEASSQQLRGTSGAATSDRPSSRQRSANVDRQVEQIATGSRKEVLAEHALCLGDASLSAAKRPR